MADDLPPLGDSGDVQMPETPKGSLASLRELLDAFLKGEPRSASTAGWRLEGPLLVGREAPLAIRVAEAVLVRAELADELGDMIGALEQALRGAGLSRIEERTVLGHVIGIEVAGIRGSEWDLWATDAEAGHDALKRRALGEVAEHIDADEPARRAREEELLDRIERDLWP